MRHNTIRAVPALLAAVALAGCAAGTPRASATPADPCHTVRVPVTIPGLAAPGEISGQECVPATANGTVLLLVAGGGENADYWDLPGLAADSLVRAANRAGYATLAVDRLGTGASTVPASSTLVTYTAQVETIHQVAAALHADRALFGRTWRTAVGIGHSLGSGTLAGVAAAHPADLTAMVLTGYGAAVTPQTLQLDALYQVPARTVAAAWANLDPGYVTVEPDAVERIGLVYGPGTSAAALAAVAAHQGTLATTELRSRPQGAAAGAQAARITGPVLVADGQYDRHYCEGNAVGQSVSLTPQCRTAAAFDGYERALLPRACLATALVTDSGHAIAEENAAPAANRTVLAWLRTAVPGGTARCAATGPYPPAD